MAYTCVKAFSNEITLSELANVLTSPKKLGLNLLYNAGSIYSNIMNYYFYTPDTVENGDWPTFVFFTLGDILMRFFYNVGNLNKSRVQI